MPSVAALGIQNNPRQGSAEASSIVWDLSRYDFSDFTKDQSQWSEKFQLLSGATASLRLYPKGQVDSVEGMAPVYLCVDKPAIVKWTWQSGRGEGSAAVRLAAA